MAGLITGENVLIDRLPYGEAAKVLPVDAERLRKHLQLTHTSDDDLILGIGGYVAAATAEVENRAGIALITQQRRQIIGDELLGDLDEQTVALSIGPVQSLTEITYLDADDAEQTLDTSLYRLAFDDVYFKSDQPTLADGPGTVWIDYVAGMGDSVDDIPAQWQVLVARIAMRMYETRDTVDGVTDKAWEAMIDRLIVVAGGKRRY